MSELTTREKRRLEEMLGMRGGYVLDFSNRTFAEFVRDSTDRDIYDARYDYSSGSKANRLRAFWNEEENQLVGKLMTEMLDYAVEIGAVGQRDDLLRECRALVAHLLAEPAHGESSIPPVASSGEEGKVYDAFISHASEDKADFVEPLAQALRHCGITTWYDRFILRPGDSLSKKIDEGLANSRYGIVVLSKHFFAKRWPEAEF
jgi:hypothetical protein